MEQCRLSIAATGAFLHPLGDQTPIDCRYGEMLDTVQLPHKQMLSVISEMVLAFGGLTNPRAVIVWNMSGLGLQVQPTEEQAAAIAAKVLEVGLIGPNASPSPSGWQSIRPTRPGQDLGGSTILWLAPGTRVVLRPATAGVNVLARVLVIPGDDVPALDSRFSPLDSPLPGQ
jgi:hypothetical protein